jgi:dGTPase
LQWNTDEFGLNLTATTIAAYLKYLRCAGEPTVNVRIRPFRKKAGYFSTEARIIEQIWREFGIDPNDPTRFPLTYIMEAADDIAYCISDLEDSIEKGLVSQTEALVAVTAKWNKAGFPVSGDQTDSRIAQALHDVIKGTRGNGADYTYTDFRTALNRAISEFVAEKYVANHDAILVGRHDESLLSDKAGTSAILKALQDYCRENVYSHSSVTRTELAGYAAISGLLSKFQRLLVLDREIFQNIISGSASKSFAIEKKLLALFPPKQIKVYLHLVSELPGSNPRKSDLLEWNLRAHLIVDFISGMTDDFAMTTYQSLSGMPS